MLWGAASGALEIRAEGGATHLSARFPYGAETELAPGRREVFAPHAFRARIEAGEEIHLLAQHDYAKPLASTAAGTLTLRSTDTALEIRATVDGSTTWANDFLAAHRAGLIRGLSPGFRVPNGGDRVERRGADLVRTVARADLFEVSAVTVPAYPSAQIEARRWQAYEALHPETRATNEGGGGRNNATRRQVGDDIADRFTADTAAKTGQSFYRWRL